MFKKFYDLLTLNDCDKKADCIFVFAGSPGRKKYAINLWKNNIARRIIFSVSRFEWRDFLLFGFNVNQSLVEAAYQTPPEKRHFFVDLNGNNADLSVINKTRLGTYTEVKELANHLKQETLRSLIVVSDDFHLPRIMLTFKYFKEFKGIKILACKVPPEISMIDYNNWYLTKASIYILVIECIKRIFYKMFLTLKKRFT